MKKFLIITTTIVAILYLSVLSALVFKERSFLYHPDPQRAAPAEMGLVLDEVSFETSDGEMIIGWYAPPDRKDKKTILFFHGNAGNLRNYAFIMKTFRKAGYGLLGVSYRGYGGSTGSPTEEGLILDGLAAYNWLLTKGHASEDMIIYGRSLGSGVATQIAAQKPARALVLESPYSAIVDVASYRFPIFPVRMVMKDTFASTSYIAKVNKPVLIMHGTKDRVVPYKFCLKLYETAVEPKKMHTYEGGSHFNLHTIGAGKDVVAWMDDL